MDWLGGDPPVELVWVSLRHRAALGSISLMSFVNFLGTAEACNCFLSLPRECRLVLIGGPNGIRTDFGEKLSNLLLTVSLSYRKKANKTNLVLLMPTAFSRWLQLQAFWAGFGKGLMQPHRDMWPVLGEAGNDFCLREHCNDFCLREHCINGDGLWQSTGKDSLEGLSLRKKVVERMCLSSTL